MYIFSLELLATLVVHTKATVLGFKRQPKCTLLGGRYDSGLVRNRL